MKRPGIFCLEGEWRGSMTDPQTVEHVLRLLEGAQTNDVIHRDVGTREELSYYATRWTQKQYSNYGLGYFAFHGEKGCLWVGRERVSLQDLASTLAGRLNSRIIYMGSCSTLAAPDDDLRQFCKTTGAKALVGYTRDVDWIESAAFDVLLLWELTHSNSTRPIFTRLCRQYPDLTRRLGFRMAMKTWVSDRKVAVSAASGL